MGGYGGQILTEAAKRNIETVSYQLLDTYDNTTIACHGSSEYRSDALTIKPLGPLAESRRQAT